MDGKRQAQGQFEAVRGNPNFVEASSVGGDAGDGKRRTQGACYIKAAQGISILPRHGLSEAALGGKHQTQGEYFIEAAPGKS